MSARAGGKVERHHHGAERADVLHPRRLLQERPQVVVRDHQDRPIGRVAREDDGVGARLVGLVGDGIEAGEVEHVVGQRGDDAVEAARTQRKQQPLEVAEPLGQGRAGERARVSRQPGCHHDVFLLSRGQALHGEPTVICSTPCRPCTAASRTGRAALTTCQPSRSSRAPRSRVAQDPTCVQQAACSAWKGARIVLGCACFSRAGVAAIPSGTTAQAKLEDLKAPAARDRRSRRGRRGAGLGPGDLHAARRGGGARQAGRAR